MLRNSVKFYLTRIIYAVCLTAFLSGCGKYFFSSLNRKRDHGSAAYSSTLKKTENLDVDFTEANLPISLSYGVIGSILEKQTTKALKRLVRSEKCEEVGTPADTRIHAKQYRCGEIPFGDIIDENYKFLLNVPFAGVSKDSGKTRYNIGGAQFPLYMTRAQKPGTMTLKFLDQGQETSFNTSAAVGSDLFFRVNPAGGALQASVCMNIPGFKVTSAPTLIRGKIKQKVAFFSVSAKVKITIDLGSVEFDSANTCAVVQLKFDPTTSKPKFEILSAEPIHFENLKIQGFRSDADTDVSGFAGFLTGVLDFVGIDIEKKINQKVQEAITKAYTKKINQVTTDDVRTARWILKYLDSTLLNSILIADAEQTLSTATINPEPAAIEMSKWLSSLCLKLTAELSANQKTKDNLFKICSLTPEINLKAFLNDPEQRAKGCYDGYFSLDSFREDRNLWWGKGCQIKSEVKIRAPEKLQPLFKCLLASIEDKSGFTARCHTEIDSFMRSMDLGEFNGEIKVADNTLLTWQRSDQFADDILRFATEIFDVSLSMIPDFADNLRAAQPKAIEPFLDLPEVKLHGQKKIKVLSYNVKGLPYPLSERPNWIFDRIAEVLKKRKDAGEGPDVIVLQEAFSPEAKKLLRYSGYPYVLVGNPQKNMDVGLDSGLAILSLYPILEAGTGSFDKTCLGSDCIANKGFLHVRLLIDGVPHPVDILTTHLQSRPGAAEEKREADLDALQIKQVEIFEDYFSEKIKTDLPLIFAGDFNNRPSFQSYMALIEKLKLRDAALFWSGKPDHHFIRSSKFIQINPEKVEKTFKGLIDGYPYSDHEGFEVQYKLEW